MTNTGPLISDDNPQICLVPSDTINNCEARTTALVWNSANTLHGNLEITSKRSFMISKATFFLEGMSRNWITALDADTIGSKIVKAEHKFLNQTQDISSSMISQATTGPEGFHLSIPFHFFITTMVASSNTNPPRHCLQLPPSIELGRVIVDDSSGKRFAQPSISYHIRAIVQFAEREKVLAYFLETSTPIIIMPHTEEFPPTDIMDFPAEFKMQDSKVLQTSFLGRKLGTMTVSMQEPRALNYNVSATRGSTEGHLKLEFQSTSLDDIFKSLQGITFKIVSLIRVKTFYSTKSFPRLPSQSVLYEQGETRMQDHIVKLEPQTIPYVSWVYTNDTAEHPPLEDFLPRGETLPFSSFGEEDESIPESVSKLNLRQPQGRWIANIVHSIGVESRLLPTFCSSIVARVYSVILRLKISGIRRDSFDLEVPLQVVHTSLDRLNEETQLIEDIPGPIGGDPAFLNFQRASATSWFSDESLVSKSFLETNVSSKQ